jgi:hypothetical protein
MKVSANYMHGHIVHTDVREGEGEGVPQALNGFVFVGRLIGPTREMDEY